MKKIIVSISLFLIFSNADSNNADSISLSKNTEITDTTYECTVVNISENTYYVAKLYGLSDSSVKILRGESSTEILIKDIKSIRFKGRGFVKGALIGGGIGFVLGFLAGASLTAALDDGGEPPDIIGPGIGGGFIFALPSGIIGGLIGSALAEDKYYDLSKMDFEAKRKKIKYLFKEFSDP